MSDFNRLRSKLLDDKNARKEITVDDGEESFDIEIRQINDDIFFEILSNVDIEEIQNSENEYDITEEEQKRYQELSSKDEDELTEEEEEELENIKSKVGDDGIGILDNIGKEGFEAFQKAGRYAIVPSDEDVSNYIDNSDETIKREDAREKMKGKMTSLLNSSHNLLAFKIGIKAFEYSYSDKGN